jgi:hypothetical protein
LIFTGSGPYRADVKLTAQEWTLIGTLGGVLVGGVLTAVNNLVQAQKQDERAVKQQNAQHDHERTLAFNAARRDAYLQVLTWFALVRDKLRTNIGSGEPWSGVDVIDPRETARIDALSEMYGSEPFRDAASKWSPAFQSLVRSHDGWLFLSDQTPSDERARDESLARAEEELQAQMVHLAEVLVGVQEVARREAAGLAAPP